MFDPNSQSGAIDRLRARTSEQVGLSRKINIHLCTFHVSFQSVIRLEGLKNNHVTINPHMLLTTPISYIRACLSASQSNRYFISIVWTRELPFGNLLWCSKFAWVPWQCMMDHYWNQLIRLMTIISGMETIIKSPLNLQYTLQGLCQCGSEDLGMIEVPL